MRRRPCDASRDHRDAQAALPAPVWCFGTSVSLHLTRPYEVTGWSHRLIRKRGQAPRNHWPSSSISGRFRPFELIENSLLPQQNSLLSRIISLLACVGNLAESAAAQRFPASGEDPRYSRFGRREPETGRDRYCVEELAVEFAKFLVLAAGLTGHRMLRSSPSGPREATVWRLSTLPSMTRRNYAVSTID
jgi:hypothetical protein